MLEKSLKFQPPFFHRLVSRVSPIFQGFGFTLPETNIAPENKPLEKEIPIGNHHFLGAMLVLGSVSSSKKESHHFESCWQRLATGHVIEIVQP